jgi:Mg-chelatase subunit ChlD
MQNVVRSRSMAGVRVNGVSVAGRQVDGDAPSFIPRCNMNGRRLQRRDVQAKVARPQRLDEPLLIQLIFDESGSMHGGNDVMGQRIEACLIALEILASVNKDRLRVHVISFDVVPPFKLDPVKLDKKGLQLVEGVLMSKSSGGSSNLLPALTEANRHWNPNDEWPAKKRLVVVLSDFELLDANVQGVFDMLNDTDNSVLAVSFSRQQPAGLDPKSGGTVMVDVVNDQPHKIAGAIIDAANQFVGKPGSASPKKRRW